MKFIFVRGLWGMEEPTLDAQLQRIAEAGFDAIEGFSPNDDARNEFLELLEKHGLQFVAQHHTAGNTGEEHADSLEQQYLQAIKVNPLLVNFHSGKDFFTLEENLKIIDRATALEKEHGVKIVHEIHRIRCTFASGPCMELIDARPDIKFCADFSHWCCVHESLLEDQVDRVDRAIANCHHIHARVGHAEGPQITHPAAPEWKNEVDVHLAWWDKIVAARKASGEEVLTICPEFGPPSYMPTLPFTNQPVADLFEVNKYMMDLLKERYVAKSATASAIK
ncbi:MAG: sugar phosphate isomerase/epimerase [Planctomycetes bacterium]|nr:sugar phosphate isomerase/epimerase [Planctomycetota bacterium]